MKLKENSRIVYDFVKEHEGENITVADIEAATDLNARQINGIITMAFQRHKEEVDGEKVEVPLMRRVPAEIEQEDGTHKQIKLIQLTDAGRSIEIEDAE